MIDKVISMILVIVIVTFASMFLFVSVFTGVTTEQTLIRQSYEQEYSETLIQSLLLSHEEDTQTAYELILMHALREASEEVTLQGTTINVTQAFTTILDELLGENNYYFEATPILEGIAVSYVFDGSPSLVSARTTVDEQLPALVDEIRDLLDPDMHFFNNIYILNTVEQVLNQQNLCEQLTSVDSETIFCEDLRGDPFYEYLSLRGVIPPIIDGFNSFNSWQLANVAASTEHLSESDWALGTVYASLRHQENRIVRDLTNKHIIITISDELASSSKADECYSQEEETDFLFCTLCKDECPTQRSQPLVDQATTILTANNDLFVGFYDTDCDYEYNDALNDFSLTKYTCQFLDSPSRCVGVYEEGDDQWHPQYNAPIASTRLGGEGWCDQDRCGACTPDVQNPQNNDYCFHSHCFDQLITQLETLAQATSGEALPLSDLDQLTGFVAQYVEEQYSNFNLQVGVRDDERDRFIVDQEIRLRDGTSITIAFWLYD